jgi:aminomethyltransferase
MGARMVPFGGWNMPVQYAGILAEHQHTRTAASLFDCSHMGQFRLRGPDLGSVLDALLPRRAGNQKIGTCRYNFLLNDRGTVIDDIIVYRMAEDEYYIVVNAGTRPGDAAHLQANLPDSIDFNDESDATVKLDIQGPKTREVLTALDYDVSGLPGYFKWTEAVVAGVPCLLSRTGYTGELGVELYSAAATSVQLWNAIVDVPEVEPAGLGARDTLRLEVGYPLYGHEMDLETTPIEAGFGGMLNLDREFIGSAALQQPPAKRLIGLRFEGRRAAREGAEISRGDQLIGHITSGSFAPSLNCAVAMAYIDAGTALETGETVQAAAGRKFIEGVVVGMPFYTDGTARS